MHTDNFGGTGRLYLLLISAFMVLIALLLSCGGGGEDGAGAGGDFTVRTPLGIKFDHMGHYSDDELEDAIGTVDDYFALTLQCALDFYPDLEDAVLALEPGSLRVFVTTPDKYDPETGKEGFTCKFYETGCTGSYDVHGSITITPSLDALGHEMGHWFNHMLLGSTKDGDPEDLSVLCKIPPLCHLYSQSRSLAACRN